MPEGVDARGRLSIRFKLVLVLGVRHHMLRIIQYGATVSETGTRGLGSSVDFLVALAHCLRIWADYTARSLPMYPNDYYRPSGITDWEWGTAAPHCLTTYLLQCLEQPACLLGATSIFGHLLDMCVELRDVQPQMPLIQQLS